MAFYTKTDQGEYVEVSEKLYTEIDYKSVKDKNNELRTTNTTLLKTNETLSAFAEVLDGVQNITPEGLMKKIEEKGKAHAERLVTDMKTKYETQVSELSQKLTGSTGTLNKLMLNDTVRKAGPKYGVQETAYDDVLRRAEADFEVREGQVVFKHERLDSEGKPYSVDTWLSETVKNAPHLATPPKGPAAAQNRTVRNNPVNNGEKRSAQDLLISGLSKQTAGPAKSLF